MATNQSELVTRFMLDTCLLPQSVNADSPIAFILQCFSPTVSDELESRLIFLISGSSAEFYIHPMLSCVGDMDVMLHITNQLAIPEGTAPPAQLPGEFDSRVQVSEIIDSEFPGYVYLVKSYLLEESTDGGQYNAVHCERLYWSESRGIDAEVDDDVPVKIHGPAYLFDVRRMPFVPFQYQNLFTTCVETVPCMRCLLWPSQAVDWPTRHRNYGWPDSATVELVVSNGCDVVPVAHRLCAEDEWMSQHQFRLSFSRAELVLLNSWTPVQQIVYHMLRVFMKTENLLENDDNSESSFLRNYHIKTLMLWACEQKPRIWWTDNMNVVKLCVELFHTLALWLNDAFCPHYFINNCNLLDHIHSSCPTQVDLCSVTESQLAEWFIHNYIHKCASFCSDKVLSLFDDISTNTLLFNAVLAVADFRLQTHLQWAWCFFSMVQFSFCGVFSDGLILLMDSSIDEIARFCPLPLSTMFKAHQICFLTVCTCLRWMKATRKFDKGFFMYFTAVSFLHGALQTALRSLDDEMLDVLMTLCLKSNNPRRCVNARHSSVLSLSQAAKLMKVVANNSLSTLQLIEIELSKSYLYRALRCKDSDNDSIHCLVNVYLAALYYTRGHYQPVLNHCSMVTRSQSQSKCGSHVVQGELLPKIDADIDNALGLAVLYQYVRTVALNQRHQTQHVGVFTTELFAHYLHVRCLSVIDSRQLTSQTAEICRYRQCFSEWPAVFITDVIVYNELVGGKKYAGNKEPVNVAEQNTPEVQVSELTELLQKSAVEHLTAFRQFEAQEFSSVAGIVTTDFEALYAYKCGQYERCLQLATQNVRTLVNRQNLSTVLMFPEFIQLLDDDIVSLFGLVLTVLRENGSRLLQYARCLHVTQLALLLYLKTQCHMKLRHSKTSLATILDYIKVARTGCHQLLTFNHLLLKLVEQKILSLLTADDVNSADNESLLYISTQFSGTSERYVN